MLIAREARKKFFGAGFGNRTQMVDRFSLTHADTVVADADGAGILVKIDLDGELAIVFKQRRIVDCLKAQLVGGVGCVRDQFAQEDFFV